MPNKNSINDRPHREKSCNSVPHKRPHTGLNCFIAECVGYLCVVNYKGLPAICIHYIHCLAFFGERARHLQGMSIEIQEIYIIRVSFMSFDL